MFSRLIFRISAPLIALSCLLLILVGCAAWLIHEQQQDAKTLLKEALLGVEASTELEQRIVRMDEALADFRRTRDAADLMRAAGYHEDAEQRLIEVERLVYSIETESLTREIRQYYLMTSRDLRSLGESGSEGIMTRNPDSIPPAKRLLEQVRSQRSMHQDRLHQIAMRGSETSLWGTRGLVVLGVLGVVIGLFTGVGMARQVQKSIVELHVPIALATGAINEVIPPVELPVNVDLDTMKRELKQLSDRVTTVVQDLQQSQTETLRAEQLAAVGQLAAGIAHEVRNPLTAMQTIVQSARESAGAELLDQRDLEILEEEILRINTSLQAFLDFARPPRLEHAPTDLRDLIDRTVQLLRPGADQQGVHLDTECAPELPRVELDFDQIRQVLINLVLNAVEFQPSGGEVRLEVELPESDPGFVHLRVLDRGPGLPDDLRDRLFDPFISSRESGSGLGLSLCRRIVLDHGGRIEASNRKGGGASFEVSLPLRQGLEAAAAPGPDS